MFVQPGCTGTRTVDEYIRANVPGAKDCSHNHYRFGDKRLGKARNSTFAFSFVANPFRRVLSYAVWASVIPGGRGWSGKRGRPNNVSHHKDVARFRAWVHKFKEKIQTSLKTQAGFLSGYKMDFVGCTSRLTSDLAAVLSLLGYTVVDTAVAVPFPAVQEHCVTGCGQDDFADWYDDASAELILGSFRPDFAQFNFSTSAQHMFDDCGAHAGDLNQSR